MRCDLSVIEAEPRDIPDLLGAIATTVDRGDLLGCWHSILGARSRIHVLMRHDDTRFKERHDAEAGWLAGAAASARLRGVTMDICVTLPCLPEVLSGAHGPYYEIRTYDLLPKGALEAAKLGWAKVIDVRRSIAPIAAVLHTVTGLTPRLVHIYPYKSLSERADVRRRAIATGHWPPAGGGARNLVMRTEIAVAASFSPLS